ncbi:hypothetical protein [Paracoccus saliphilus]|uniref:hypothetical protein n=1 Tax=Paracoccus saliphilus TaxID=405559 RepID=UPI00158AEB9E|nr:hypothetical protein [Paracoccus saliphilus]
MTRSLIACFTPRMADYTTTTTTTLWAILEGHPEIRIEDLNPWRLLSSTRMDRSI